MSKLELYWWNSRFAVSQSVSSESRSRSRSKPAWAAIAHRALEWTVEARTAAESPKMSPVECPLRFQALTL